MNAPHTIAIPSPRGAGYNETVLRHARLRFMACWALKAFCFLALVLALAYGGVYYLANLPRERAEVAGTFISRALLGGQDVIKGLYSSLTAPELGKGASQLPVFEIYIAGRKLDSLNQQLPASGSQFQKGLVRVIEKAGEQPKEFAAKVRYRGDSMNHWAFPQKSWRIRLARGKSLGERRVFNLYLPRLSSKVADYMGYHLGRQFGLHSPDAYPVHFRLNRRYDGLRMYLEQVDQAFLARRNLEPGEIFQGDIDTSQIYGNKKRPFLFRDAAAWEVIQPNLDRGTADKEGPERDSLRHLASVLFRRRPLVEVADKFHEIIDVESTLSYIAMLQLVSSNHVDDTHNQKWYLNPQLGVLQPIVWDTVAYYHNHVSKFDYSMNQLQRLLIAIPHFRDQKNRILWRALRSFATTESLVEYVRRETKRIKPDVTADPFKLVAQGRSIQFLSTEEWQEGINTLIERIKTRNTFLESELSRNKALYILSPGTTSRTLTIRPESTSSLHLTSITVPLHGSTSKTEVELVRRGVTELMSQADPEAIRTKGHVHDGEVTFACDDILSPLGTSPSNIELKSEPSRFQYEIRVKGPGSLADGVRLYGYNETTGEAYKEEEWTRLSDESSLPQAAPGWWRPELFMPRKVHRWSGVVEVKENLTFGRFEDLTIAPGTTIRIAPKVSILVNGGNLIAEGTQSEPIVIESLDTARPFGALGIQGYGSPLESTSSPSTPKVSLAFVRFRGGSEGRAKYTYLAAPFSVHHASLAIRDSLFDGATIRIVGGSGTISRTSFTDVTTEPIAMVRASLEQHDVTVHRRVPRHLLSDVNLPAVGTAPRSEREYRFSVLQRDSDSSQKKELEAEAMALAAKKALEAAVTNRALWKAEPFALGTYRTSTAVGEAVYRDIYIDTADFFNRDHHISYRLRNRFADRRTHDAHIKNPRIPDYWPYRIEFQGKTGRSLGEGDMTTVTEARLEFRKQSQPFGDDFLPPPPPWPIPQFLPMMLEGRLYGMVTTPAKLVMGAYRDLGYPESSVQLQPTVAVATTRRRQHLEIKTRWGSGPNPDQAYIITVDDSYIYPIKEYLEAIEKGWRGDAVTIPRKAGRLLELEIEFERNVSDALEKELEQAAREKDTATVEKLQQAQQAFLDDLGTIVAVVNQELEPLGFQLTPVFESKYRQALMSIQATSPASGSTKN